MGLSRDSRHKHRKTGGRMPIHKKKRAYEKARQPAMTKLGQKRIRPLRVRGGNQKFRALRLDHGNFNWPSEASTKKARIMAVVYNATNNELVRTNTLTKNTIVQIDATPFRVYYYRQYGVELGKGKEEVENKSQTAQAQQKWQELQAAWKQRAEDRYIDPHVVEQFKSGRLLAAISSRPGQSGRADGYVLEGDELEFYKKKLMAKKKTKQ